MAHRNEDIVADLYERFARGDIAGITEHFDRDVVILQTEELPWGGTFEGVTGFKQFVEGLRGTVQARLTVEETFVAGAQVVAIGRTAGTVVRTDVAFDIRFVHVWTLVGGKVTRFEAFVDTPEMIVALHRKKKE